MTSSGSDEGERRLNVLFITCDQLRRDGVGAMGLDTLNAVTPHMDQLAAEGTLFTQHITNALPCGPSRTALHCGILAMNHRVVQNGTPLADRHTNWPREFKGLGLDPVLLGHTSTPQDPRQFHPNDPILKQTHAAMPGFNPLFKSDMHDISPKAWATWLELTHGYTHDGVKELYSGYTPPGSSWLAPTQLQEDGSAFYKTEHSDSAFMCLKAKEYIHSRQQTDPDVPWSLHLSLWRPHPPWVCTAPYHQMYDPDQLQPFVRKPSAEEEAQAHPWLGWDTSATLPASRTDEATLRHMRSQYLGSVSEVDSQIGELFEFLKASGEWERTLIVLTADHGEQLADHWQLGKLGFFRQSYEIPLIIRDPRASADGGRGQRVAAVTEHIDIAPTLIEAMGGTVPAAMDGNSLMPFIRDGPNPPIGAS